MDLLFGRRKTPEELLRQNQRALARAMRELDRERQKLETQEKKIIVDIKKMAKQGQMDAVKIMAKDLVRTRRYVKKFITMRANVQAVSLKIQTLKSNNSMAQAMKGVTKAMATMNRQLKLPQIQKIMMEFEKQAEIMDMKEELMNDAIDDAMGDEDDEEESAAPAGGVAGSGRGAGARGCGRVGRRRRRPGGAAEEPAPGLTSSLRPWAVIHGDLRPCSLAAHGDLRPRG
ncbi:charged multivesicular body protein 2a isoform X1 [Rhea pennata]|uniref:charged multivesicular body protein 2a isoform X1 n=1 Tax=Rhea pennata TaxID=8795 RepID=UPI002E270CE7